MISTGEPTRSKASASRPLSDGIFRVVEVRSVYRTNCPVLHRLLVFGRYADREMATTVKRAVEAYYTHRRGYTPDFRVVDEREWRILRDIVTTATVIRRNTPVYHS